MNSASSPDSNPEEREMKSPFSSLLSEEEKAPEEGGEPHEIVWHSALKAYIPPDAPNVWGESVRFPESEFTEQGYSDTCAIRCQEVILHQYGHDVDEETLIHRAEIEGLYLQGQGTLPEDVGKLLEDYDVHVHQYQHASVFNLTVELAQGHMVMIGVNANELHRPLLEDIAHMLHVDVETADHVVIVSGIDTHDPEHVQVIVSDPSTGEVAARYPLESFVHAWEGSDFFVTATDEPLPLDHHPEMEHFDYVDGHIAEVAGMPYDQFEGYADSPEDVAHMFEAYLELHEDGDTHDLDDTNPEGDTNYADDTHIPLHNDATDDFHLNDIGDSDDTTDTDDIGDIGF